jgi:uncharacterized protein
MDTSHKSLNWKETELQLLASGCLFIPSMRLLVVADMHLGKAAHFRKNGIPLPKSVNQNNLWKLSAVLDEIKPAHLLFLGDLFHSVHNSEWEEWVDFLENYPEIRRILVCGNHDILDTRLYEQAQFLTTEKYALENLIFSHDEIEKEHSEELIICGHIHPAVRLSSNVHKGLRLPCFYLHEGVLILPAFGEFTGMKTLSPSRNARIFAISGDEIVDLSGGDQTDRLVVHPNLSNSGI